MRASLPGGAPLAGVLLAVSQGAAAQESYVATGIGGSANDAFAWQAATATPFGGLDETGPVMRALLTQVRFRYRTSLPDDPDATIEAQGWLGEAEAGWQWVEGGARLALLAGAAARQYDLSPDDPGSSLAGFRWSASFSAAGTMPLGFEGWAVAGEATVRPQVEELWAQVRPGYDCGDGFRIGPEAAVNRGDGYLFVRAGAFATGYRLPLTLADIYLGASGGVSFEPDGFSPSPYGGLWLGVKF